MKNWGHGDLLIYSKKDFWKDWCGLGQKVKRGLRVAHRSDSKVRIVKKMQDGTEGAVRTLSSTASK